MYPYIEKTVITDLGFGAGFALWSFRAMASGCGGCRTLRSGFHKAFASDSRAIQCVEQERAGLPAMKAMADFCRLIGTIGKRKITLSSSGTLRLTADELSLVATLSAAQTSDKPLSQAHLLWLLGTSETELTYQAAVEYGLICAEAEIYIHAPKIEISSLEVSATAQCRATEPQWSHSERFH